MSQVEKIESQIEIAQKSLASTTNAIKRKALKEKIESFERQLSVYRKIDILPTKGEMLAEAFKSDPQPNSNAAWELHSWATMFTTSKEDAMKVYEDAGLEFNSMFPLKYKKSAPKFKRGTLVFDSMHYTNASANPLRYDAELNQWMYQLYNSKTGNPMGGEVREDRLIIDHKLPSEIDDFVWAEMLKMRDEEGESKLLMRDFEGGYTYMSLKNKLFPRPPKVKKPRLVKEDLKPKRKYKLRKKPSELLSEVKTEIAKIKIVLESNVKGYFICDN